MTTVAALRTSGHDVKHLRDECLYKLPDSQILDKARIEGQTVIAFDLDFGDLLAAGGQTRPSVVILRVADQTPVPVNPRLRAAVARCEAELAGGAVVIVEQSRYRVRRFPSSPMLRSPRAGKLAPIRPAPTSPRSRPRVFQGRDRHRRRRLDATSSHCSLSSRDPERESVSQSVEEG
jgi:predicted nuclease of predicted toxin-antitoxin system